MESLFETFADATRPAKSLPSVVIKPAIKLTKVYSNTIDENSNEMHVDVMYCPSDNTVTEVIGVFVITADRECVAAIDPILNQLNILDTIVDKIDWREVYRDSIHA